ncbi:lysophospholipid acyltransferase family protein [Aureibaculum sp. 2210JD6-5]|uniref:lysophospholipid acyltransferase family protein n=1 Tax=Aureibaculum sp. 2210JD6-5 TaxID=3103957 RepID=UPI002AAE339B|nr:lysophospholipid acyltransferase family protein [Aureibaculum sp. 2210JD6-5]MDY7396167.1 lysophospholipid acyltransferase family protein [Aureibaculum sp. 2210JD6-5]
MNILKNIFRIFWRTWFYGWIFFSILFALPILVIVISFDSLYKTFFKIAIAWGKTILFVMGFKPVVEIEEEILPGKSYLFIANHASLIDVMLMLSVMKNPAVFVGKKELVKLPLFGYVFRKTSIWVDRSSEESRKRVYILAQKKLDEGLSIAIFPEGLVPEKSVTLAPFKNGAFRLAIEHQIPIVPMTFYDVKKRFSWKFFSGWPGKLRVKIHKFIQTEGLILDDMETIKQQAFDTIYNELVEDMGHKT